jgi:hypothetical protein
MPTSTSNSSTCGAAQPTVSHVNTATVAQKKHKKPKKTERVKGMNHWMIAARTQMMKRRRRRRRSMEDHVRAVSILLRLLMSGRDSKGVARSKRDGISWA